MPVLSRFYGIVIFYREQLAVNWLRAQEGMPLRDTEYFERFRVDPETRTIEWPNGADLAPEFLYEVGTEVERVG